MSEEEKFDVYGFLLPIRIIIMLFFVSIIVFGFIFIHELGHILACWHLGIENTRLTITDNFEMKVHYTAAINKDDRRFITLSGSGFAILVAFALWCHGIKSRNTTFFISSYMIIIYNLLGWLYGAYNTRIPSDASHFMFSYQNFNPNFIMIPCMMLIGAFTAINMRIFKDRFFNYYLACDIIRGWKREGYETTLQEAMKEVEEINIKYKRRYK